MPAGLLLHIGLHKTASTFLQRNLFDAPGSKLVTPHTLPRQALVRNLVRPDPLAYDAAAVRACYEPFIEDARQRGDTPVLSHERFSGYPSSGGRDRADIAERLRRTFPEGRVLIVIREQRSLIASMYRQHITDGGVGSIRAFLETPEPALCRRPSFDPTLYEFDRLIRLYRKLFGDDRVLVLPMERLALDPGAFVHRIAGFCEQEWDVAPLVERSRRANAARPMVMQMLQRPLNHLFFHNELSPGALWHVPRFNKRYATLKPLLRLLSPAILERRLERRLNEVVAAFAGDRYAASNARTEALAGTSLRALGYAMPTAPEVAPVRKPSARGSGTARDLAKEGPPPDGANLAASAG